MTATRFLPEQRTTESGAAGVVPSYLYDGRRYHFSDAHIDNNPKNIEV
ncbi:hypothetical protein QE432_003436 [Agrobacterium sp. SORGH_AS 745]|nr:hypothetical protein [Agrobacterium tumefaciens]MDQ1221855.1 hypothetical protein [Agrobacterium sp. SORGH_AS_0745]